MTQIQSTYRILLFGNNNNIRLQRLFDELAKLQEEYFVLEGEGKNTKIKLKEGKTQHGFEKEYTNFLDTKITIAL